LFSPHLVACDQNRKEPEMLTILERSSGNVLGVRARGKLTHADYQMLVPKLEELIREHGRIRVLFELEDCQGWDVGAAWDDLRFAFKHGGDFDRCAVVGEKAWQKWMTKLSQPFFKARYFDRSELDRAWEWILEGVPSTLAGAGV
jgi:hypothetical protein